MESPIQPVRHCADGTLGGTYRAAMTPEHMKGCGYGRRWHAERFIGGFKRVTGSTLTARNAAQQIKGAAIRVVAYALYRKGAPSRRDVFDKAG